MTTNPIPPPDDPARLNHVIEIVIRLAVLSFLLGWCIVILSPFVSLMLWGLIIAVSAYPFFSSLRKRFKGRSGWAATLVTVLFLAALIIPAALLTDSLIEGISNVRDIYRSGKLVIPAPDERVKNWPAIAKPIADFWTLASQNIQTAVSQFEPQIKKALGVMLGFLGSTGLGVLQLLGSTIIAGLFLNYSDQGTNAMRSIFVRLAGRNGVQFVELSAVTIRSTVKGILGVATIQALLAGIGYFVAGVPLAGLWTLFSLIFAIVQVGVGPILIPVIVYEFYSQSTLHASVFLGWSLFVMVSDNILKPILLGRGTPVPMLVVFLGSVGGFIANGFLGLFLGPVMLSLGYTLYTSWVKNEADGPPAPPAAE